VQDTSVVTNKSALVLTTNYLGSYLMAGLLWLRFMNFSLSLHYLYVQGALIIHICDLRNCNIIAWNKDTILHAKYEPKFYISFLRSLCLSEVFFFTVSWKTSYAGSTVCVIPKIQIFTFGNVGNTGKKVVLKSQRV
jgi:hypothetical protein